MSADSPVAIGFVGLGRMGSRIARNLAGAGHQIKVWNRTASVAEQWATDNGADVADSLSDLAAGSRILITMLADGDALASV
ncbi:MAG TPA: NAD(P)-binding domain-containing protein, partial [Acidimicrobiia bacterium]|nr:NAD(P)-binding domain-containing protein [Acidimicrobiia bacterium]